MFGIDSFNLDTEEDNYQDDITDGNDSISGGAKNNRDDDTISLHLSDTLDDVGSPGGSPGGKKDASSCDTQEEDMDIGDAAANLGIKYY